MNKQKFIILKGIPASGKSTWARKWVKESPKDRVIINRDSIRRMLGIYWVPNRESLVTIIETTMVTLALEKGYNITLDSTNLNPNYMKKWEDIASKFDIEIHYIYFNISLEEAIERDKCREFSVGKDVIIKFYNQYHNKSD